jgi:hypothetical protein
VRAVAQQRLLLLRPVRGQRGLGTFAPSMKSSGLGPVASPITTSASGWRGVRK